MKFSRRRDIVISTDPGKRAKVGCSRLLGDHELLWTHEGMLDHPDPILEGRNYYCSSNHWRTHFLSAFSTYVLAPSRVSEECFVS